LRVPVGEIKSALEFLVQHGYLEIRENGAVVTPKETLQCKGEVYENALIEYHRQMLQAAGDSVTETHYRERHLQGFTLPTNPARYEAALKILKRAMTEIEALEKNEDGSKEAVHHVEIAMFPLVRGKSK
ncbi:MAG TPA: TIGR02147 family protein, partial [Bdellovibrionota bacterium]|nr:TIGR02147 family protein [Bdellovibrionota bacterium]